MVARIGFEFDPFDLTGLPEPTDRKAAAAAREEIAKYVEEQVIAYCGDGKSPVAGGDWKKSLSKEYKKRKVAEGGNPYADMILTGDMLSAMDCVIKRGGMLDLRVTGKENVAKADGHNNFSGASQLPRRQFLPEEDGTFTRAIIAGMRDIIEKYSD